MKKLFGSVFPSNYSLGKETTKLRKELEGLAIIAGFSKNRGYLKVEAKIIEHLTQVEQEMIELCQDPDKNKHRMMTLWAYRRSSLLLLSLVHAPDKKMEPTLALLEKRQKLYDGITRREPDSEDETAVFSRPQGVQS